MAKNHTRDYYRKVRKHHIKRKKKIDKISMARSYSSIPYYSCDGKYSKNKVHCSCDMCSIKSTRDYLNRHDAVQKQMAEEQYAELGLTVRTRGKVLRSMNLGPVIEKAMRSLKKAKKNHQTKE